MDLIGRIKEKEEEKGKKNNVEKRKKVKEGSKERIGKLKDDGDGEKKRKEKKKWRENEDEKRERLMGGRKFIGKNGNKDKIVDEEEDLNSKKC